VTTTLIEPSELARRIIELLSDRQAEDVVLLDIHEISSFTDYFVIASAQNPRHMNALLDAFDKDQSYVLYTLGQAELSRLLFPVGEYTKPAVRQLALEMGLPLHDKPDSAEICFVPGNDYRAFLAARLPQLPGEIVTLDGGVVGRHEGVAGYTIGQRKGIGAFGGKRFVTAIDAERNLLTIGDEADLLQDVLWAEDPRWCGEGPPAVAFEALVKVRYKSPPVRATVRLDGGDLRVEFQRPLRAITPGQAAVIYDDAGRVIGGGTIARAGSVSRVA